MSSADGVCTQDSATVMVTVNQRQTQEFFSDTIFCEGDSVQLTAQAGMNFYQWNYDNSTISSANLTIKKTGQVTLYMIDNNSCQYRDTLEAEERMLPTFSLGNDTTICDNLSITLTGPAGMSSYNWNGTVGTSSTYVTNVSQTHTLTVTDDAGCEYTDNIQVLTNPSSSFSLGNDTAICEGTSLELFIPAVLKDYKWNGTASTSTSFTATGPGTYFAEAANSFDCPSYDTIVISELAAPRFDLGNDTGFCDVIDYTLSGPAGAASYEWSDASDNQTLDISAIGEYFLNVVGTNGCLFSDTINVELFISPIISLGNDTILPASGNLTLTPGAGFAMYDWSTGESSESIVVSDTGMYSVQVTDTNGCTASDEIWVPSTASVGFIDGVEYSLYPNPVSNSLILSLENVSVNARYVIVDLQGKQILESAVKGKSQNINVSELQNGLYKLILFTDDKSLTFSVLVSH